MKIRFACIFIVLFLIWAQAEAYSINSLSSEKETIYPYLVEYISDFSISSDDLQRLLQNQFRRIVISNITTSSYQVYNNSIVLSHKGESKTVQQINPLKVKVTNDSFQLMNQFLINVIHTLGSKNYACQSKISEVLISYVKEVDFASGKTLITNLTSSYSSQSFEQPTCNSPIATKDKSAINDAVNSTKTASIYLELKKTFDKIQQYLSHNAQDERLSKVYDSNPYSYDYYGFKIDVNVSTIRANQFQQNGIQNQILGTISETSTAAVQPPQYEQGYSTFISLQFIQNLIEFTKNNYGSWQAVRLTRNNMRTRFFKFRLIDFEYIIPNVLRDYPNKYMSDVEIQCAAQALGDTTLDEEYLNQSIDWRCLGSFEAQNNKKVVFLNFLVGIKYTVQLFALQNSMGVRVDEVKLLSLNFDYVDKYEVVDPFTLAEYINEGLFEFRVYTIGTFFKVSSPNQIKKQIPQRGVWVG